MNEINRLMSETGRSFQAGDHLGAADLFRQALHVDASPFADAARHFVAGFPVQDVSQFWRAPADLYPAGAGVEDIFAFIYDRSVWGGGSGAGSNLPVTVPYIGYLRYLMERHGVRTIVDIGCGDWRFARHSTSPAASTSATTSCHRWSRPIAPPTARRTSASSMPMRRRSRRCPRPT
jgi:hypothetical protein